MQDNAKKKAHSYKAMGLHREQSNNIKMVNNNLVQLC